MKNYDRFCFVLRMTDRIGLEKLAKAEGRISKAAVLRKLIYEASQNLKPAQPTRGLCEEDLPSLQQSAVWSMET